MHLPRQLLEQHRPAGIRPPGHAEHEAGDDERGRVRGVMVAVDLRALGVALDEVGVQVQAPQKA
jgi:hypothetical protein